MWKPILLTLGASLAGLSLTLAVLAKPLLSAMGLSLVPVSKVAEWRASQQAVQKLRKRNASRRAKAPRRLVRRAGRRVGSALVASVSLGAPAVALTLTGLELSDYCDEQQQLAEEADLLNGTRTEFDFQRCLEQAGEQTGAILAEAGRLAMARAEAAWQDSLEAGRAHWAEAMTGLEQAARAAREQADQLWDQLRELLPDSQLPVAP